MRVLRLKRANFHGVAYADGGLLLTLNSRRRLRVWGLATFEERLALELPEGWWRGERFLSLHGGLLAANGAAWDLGPGCARLVAAAALPRPTLDLSALRVAVEGLPKYAALVAAPGGDFLVGCGWGGPAVPGSTSRGWVYVWDRQGRLQNRFHGLRVVGRVLAVAPGCRLLAVSSDWKQALLIALPGGEVRATLTHTDTLQQLQFSPDGRLLAAAAGRCVWLWDAATGKAVARFPAFRRFAESVAFHPDGRLLAGGGRDGEVRLWDVPSLREVERMEWGIGTVHGLAFAPDGATAAAAGHNSAVVVWDVG
jgi:WD40 repeat protein